MCVLCVDTYICKQKPFTMIFFFGMHNILCFLKTLKNHMPPSRDFPGGSDGKASAYNAGDSGSIPGLGRSPGAGNGNPLQYSCLENPVDGGAWWAIFQRVTMSRT